MSALLNAWFSGEGFMPHGHCYLWNPQLVWLHVLSDSAIFFSYVTIPATLVYFVRRRKDLPFDWMFMCFGVFIISCGLTHLMEVWTLWHPSYWLSGAVKMVTAFASLLTAVLLMQLVPKALALPSPSDLRRVSAALEASEARFRAAAEGSQDAFCILDAVRDEKGQIEDLVYVYANTHAQARLPQPVATELSGRRLREVVPAELAAEFIQRCDTVLQQGRPLEEELSVTFPSAPSRWIQRQIVPLGAGVAVTSRDISQRKRAEEALRSAEARFRSLLESAPDAMVIADETGHIVFVNAQTQKLFGYTAAELIDQSVEILLRPRAQSVQVGPSVEYFLDPRLRALGSESDLHGRHKDGSEFPVEINLSPLATETGTLVSSAIRDVSARRAIERALKLANQELEAFSYSVAHDLRAPIRGMGGFAQILLEDYSAVLDDEGRDCVNEILGNAQRMAQLIDALLSLSRVTRTEPQLERVDMSALVTSVASELSRVEADRKVEIAVQPGVSAMIDQALARTLLLNLLGNAWKFTANVAQARVEFGVCSRDDGAAFFVRDNGAGFNMEFASKLFTPFQRLHTTRQFPGTGIGLATVQRIVHRHGGQVWAEGNINAGATFYFWLPTQSLGAAA